MYPVRTLWALPALKRLSLALLCLLVLNFAFAADRYAVATGNWNATSTWSATSGGAPGATVPGSGDNAYIPSGITVTLTAAVSGLKTIDVTGTLNVNSTLTLGSRGLAAVNSGGLVVFTSSAVITGGGPGANSADAIFYSGAKITTANTSGVNSSITVNGTITIQTGVSYTFTGATTTPFLPSNTASTTIKDLTITAAVTLNQSITATGTITTTADLTVNSSNVLTVNGVLTPGATNLVKGTGTLTGTGTAQATRITTGSADFLNQYTISNKVYTNLTIDYAGAGAQTVNNGPSYNNLKASGSGTKTAAGSLNLTGNLTVSGTATLDLMAFTANTSSASKTLQLDNGATLRIGSSNSLPSNYSTYALDPGSTVEFYGNNQVVASASRTYGNLILSGTNTSTNFGFTAAGDFSINSGGAFNAGTFTINVKGNFTNDGTFTPGTSTINLNGTGTQTISGIAAATTFTNLAVAQGTVASKVTIAQQVFVTGILTLTTGIVNTPALASASLPAFLRLNNGASVSGASDNSFVDGPITKTGNSAFVFPVGRTTGASGTTATGYNPISISAPSVATDAFTANYMNASATALSPTKASGLEATSACQYWNLNQTTGNSSVNVTLAWRQNSACHGGYINDPSTVVVAHYNGASWDTYGRSGGNTGNATAGTVTWNNVSTFSPFTIGTTNGNLNPLPVRFVSFEGRNATGSMQLSWQVGAAQGTKGYEVERKEAGGLFAKIGFVAAGAGSRYVFTDAGTHSSLVSYRIKTISDDGSTTYSNILTFQNGKSAILFQVSPTVVLGKAVAQHEAAGAGAVLNLSDMTGKQVKMIKPQAGALQTDVDMTGLRPGLYILRFNNGNGAIQTVKLIKQ